MFGKKAEKTFNLLINAYENQKKNDANMFTRRGLSNDVSYVTQSQIIDSAIENGIIEKLDYGVYRITPKGENVINRIKLLIEAMEYKNGKSASS